MPLISTAIPEDSVRDYIKASGSKVVGGEGVKGITVL